MKKYIPLIIIAIILISLGIYKIIVLDIKWDGINADETTAWQKTDLPSSAVQIEEVDSQADLLRQSMYLWVPVLIVFLTVMVVGKKRGMWNPSKSGVIAGTLSSFALQPLHELLHALSIPGGNEVHIGIIRSSFSGYASSTAPMNIIECILYYIVPALILGIVPLILFIFRKDKNNFLSWFLYGFALCGIIQTAPDWFGLFPIISQVPRGAVIQASGYHTFWYIP